MSDSLRDASAKTMKVLPFLLLFFSVALANDTGKTPVETGAGVVPLENCILKSELEHDMEEISEQMLAFGISRSTTKSYSNFVLHEAASPTKKSGKVLCIPPARVREVGTRLGNIIWDFMEDSGPTKRRGDQPQFDFDPERDEDNTIAQAGKCCVCEDSEFPRRDGGAWRQGCWRGPCCPQLCRSLNQLQVAASDGVTGCCNRNYRPCLHEAGVSEGQRGGKDPLFT